MLSATLSLLATLSLPPYLVVNKGTLQVETPSGSVLIIPEGSSFLVNSHGTRLDLREVTLDNVGVFKDGFE
jgi:hypothetical protein